MAWNCLENSYIPPLLVLGHVFSTLLILIPYQYITKCIGYHPLTSPSKNKFINYRKYTLLISSEITNQLRDLFSTTRDKRSHNYIYSVMLQLYRSLIGRKDIKTD